RRNNRRQLRVRTARVKSTGQRRTRVQPVSLYKLPSPSAMLGARRAPTSREQMQQTRNKLGQPPSFSLRQRLGDFAGAFDEEFDRRTEGSILQSKDRHF